MGLLLKNAGKVACVRLRLVLGKFKQFSKRGGLTMAKKKNSKDKKLTEAQIAVHWKEEDIVHPSPEFIAQANMTDPGIYDRFSRETILT